MNDAARQEGIVEEARGFAETEIRPRARDFDRTGVLDRELIEKMAAKGYLLASLPQKHGGLGLAPVFYGRFTEEIGKACCSTRALITVQSSLVGEVLSRCGSEEQRRHWLPDVASGRKLGAFALTEPQVGTDARAVQTVYRATDGGYQLNGCKKWTSFGGVADFFIVIARRDEELSAFLVDRAAAGLTCRPMSGLLAARASHLAEVELKEVFVPEQAVIGSLGGGFVYVAGTALDHGRYSIAWGGVAVAQACVEAMATYARKRRQFSRKIGEFQLIQGLIADAVTETHAARSLCLKAGELRESGHRNAVVETCIAKYFSSKVAVKVAADAVQVHGGNGCIDSFPVERLYREAKLLEIIEGTSQIQQQLIAKYGLRQYFKP